MGARHSTQRYKMTKNFTIKNGAKITKFFHFFWHFFCRYISEVEAHKFDLLVCDEGHRLKNSNIKTTQLLNRLNCPRRIILTGTPLQNDLNEFYTLVDFVNPNVLGTPAEFRSQFAEAIVSSRQPNADECLIKKGKECAQNLKKITSKFLLRRTRDILKGYLPPRHDIVVFCKITPGQRSLYNSSIDSFFDGINSGVCDGSTYLELITTLKKICNHPSLLKKQLGDEVRLFVTLGNFISVYNPAKYY